MKRLVVLTVLGLAGTFIYGAAGAQSHDGWVDVQSMSQAVYKSDLYRKSDPARLRVKPEHRKALDPIRRTRNLVQELSRSRDLTEMQVNSYMAQFQSLENQMDGFASTFPPAEGPAACMQECDAAYPGFGHGNGLNRAMCKAACLAIAINGNNND